MTQAPTGRPPERYGEDRPQWHRTLARVLTAALALVALGWVVWAGLGLAQRDVRWQDVGFDVQDATTVDVTFEVTVYADEGAARVTCTIEALELSIRGRRPGRRAGGGHRRWDRAPHGQRAHAGAGDHGRRQGVPDALTKMTPDRHLVRLVPFHVPRGSPEGSRTT